MRILRHPRFQSANARAAVVAIGNFDGVHRGHQAIILKLLDISAKENLIPTIVTFEPHPLEFLRPDLAPPRIMSWQEKMRTLRELGIEQVLSLRFDKTLANTSHRNFVDKYLLHGTNAKQALIGEDFRFGHKRLGDAAFMKSYGASRNIQVNIVSNIESDGVRISSSIVRQKLGEGDFPVVRELLGRPYSNSGRIGHGDKLGRTFGFPTINLNLKRNKSPLSGVFAVLVHGLGNNVLPGAAYVGTRPAVDGEELVLETYLLDFDQDVYGRTVTVEYLKKMRDELSLDGAADLRLQIKNDVDKVRQYFSDSNALATAGKWTAEVTR